jgi:hypothetical protein
MPDLFKAESVQKGESIEGHRIDRDSPDGVFVALEMPGSYDDNPDLRLTTIMDVHYDECNAYYGRATDAEWKAASFPKLKDCLLDPYFKKYSQLNLGISYFEAAE